MLQQSRGSGYLLRPWRTVRRRWPENWAMDRSVFPLCRPGRSAGPTRGRARRGTMPPSGSRVRRAAQQWALSARGRPGLCGAGRAGCGSWVSRSPTAAARGCQGRSHWTRRDEREAPGTGRGSLSYLPRSTGFVHLRSRREPRQQRSHQLPRTIRQQPERRSSTRQPDVIRGRLHHVRRPLGRSNRWKMHTPEPPVPSPGFPAVGTFSW